jgi:hypothetical protein
MPASGYVPAHPACGECGVAGKEQRHLLNRT